MTKADDRAASSGRHPRRPLRVVEDVLVAFHLACDLQDEYIAWRLLVAAEDAMRLDTTAAPTERVQMASRLVSAHERIWSLFHEEGVS